MGPVASPAPSPPADATRRRLVLGAAASLLGGCASAPPAPQPTAPPRPFWPRPPDRPRFLLEGTLRKPADILGD